MAPIQPTPLRPEEPFCFRCAPEADCFNHCCRDLNQFLTPYDVLRLKKRLDLASGDFLARYTRWHIGPETGLPVLTLKEADPIERACPFVGDTGCSVYDDRPSSCRIYPLIRTVGRNRKTGQPIERYLLLRESHCHGFGADTAQTAAGWVVAQGLGEYNRFNDELFELIRLKRHLRPGPLDAGEHREVFMALYDLDAFRRWAGSGGDHAPQRREALEKAAAAETDAQLLRSSMRWLKAALFD